MSYVNLIPQQYIYAFTTPTQPDFKLVLILLTALVQFSSKCSNEIQIYNKFTTILNYQRNLTSVKKTHTKSLHIMT